ncbi:metallophosphoesterase family protein [Arcticibacterium luteifluviistationis]|uniref:Metallophosphoesterase n=1 Tax=Arcticibacterium luteifluviistationis TaxID=1784714 RepID=A0A2Z4GG41_9BACT|nr:metallophosphoesterase [Arcticibacterium luteifluviistationis]AWW00360.1 metallophosphoesterase [Arcticibacterium luteifluviistationis]
MNTSRRDFLRNASMATLILGAGGFQSLSANELSGLKSKVKLRFLVASDAHYGQPNTPFEAMFDNFRDKANLFQNQMPSDFCVINGDLIHDEPHLMPLVKAKADQLEIPYYVTKGNHDKISDSEWNTIWGMPVNFAFEEKGTAFLFATTSDENGTYLSPDLTWMRNQLDSFAKPKNVFIFIHIPQAKWTANGIETPEFFLLLRDYPNIRAVFHGHEHDQDGVRMHNDIPFIFDSHIGGSWGTDYKGFRVVELLKDNSIITYMMDPVKAREKEMIKAG